MNLAEPAGGYLLCASPRSGSTLLCDLLRRTGIAGAPESYFRPASIPGFADRWRLAPNAGGWGRHYVNAARVHGDADSGRFGMRIMWTDMPVFLERLARLYPEADSDRELLRAALGVDRFVHLCRDDKIAQAVSLVLAIQTGLWHQNADGSERQRGAPPAPPRYDHDQIATELRMLETEAAGWRDWFEETGVVPMTLSYEELAADPTHSLARVLAHLGIDAEPHISPGTSQMATDLNQQWAAKFQNERKLPRRKP